MNQKWPLEDMNNRKALREKFCQIQRPVHQSALKCKMRQKEGSEVQEKVKKSIWYTRQLKSKFGKPTWAMKNTGNLN